MVFKLLPFSLRSILRRRPLILYTATWTALLTSTVALTSFTPEIAFVWASSPSSSFARACSDGFLRVPLEGPAGDMVCLPAQLFGKSKAVDFFVPPLFAALVVGGAACFVRAVGLWEVEDGEY